MISREELELIVSGAVQQAALGIESAHGRALTRTEIERLSAAFRVATHMVIDRCTVKAAPPPPPVARERHHGRFFQPLPTQQLLRPVSAEDIEAARKAGQK